MKKIKKISLWVMLVVYLVLISGFVSARRDELLCNKVNVVIADSVSKKFIESDDILGLLNKNEQLPLGNPVANVNTNRIEKMVLANSLVKHCMVYNTVDGKLNIELQQREPIVRIIDKKGRNYYLDDEGSVINMSKRFTPHLLVVNGNIHTPFNPKSLENVFDKKFNGKAERLRDIHRLATFVSKHEFWNSQIVQAYVDKKGEFEIIPRIGPHLIELGTMKDFEIKLNKLWVFYNHGLNSVGWNKYLKISLKYKDQIVCSKT